MTLGSIGSTIAIEVAPGSGGRWTFTGTDQLCTQVYTIDALSAGANDDPGDLGPICWKHHQIDIGPTGRDLPILVFDRDGSSATVTVSRTK